MIDDMTQMIKEKLLEDLISQMSEGHAGRALPPKGMGVEVQAHDKAGLEHGLEKAKSVLGKANMPDAASAEGESASEEDDERRLMDLLEDDEDEKGH